MVGTELSKSQKKIARKIIETGLQREFSKGIQKLDNIILKWKSKEIPDKETWHELYGELIDYDKHIADRYDRMSGSRYLYIIASQLAEGVIDKDSLLEFNEEVREKVLYLSGIKR